MDISKRVYYLLAVLVFMGAMGLRLWQLNDLPAGITEAETITIRLAEQVRQGRIGVFLEGVDGYPYEALYPTALAFTTTFAGSSLIVWRLFSVWAGGVTLALVYALGSRLFGRGVGLLAMALLAVNFWAVLSSRLIVTYALLPLIVTLVLFTLVHAMRIYRRTTSETNTTTLAFAALGGTLGFSLYVHAAGLLLVLGAMFFITYYVLTHRPVPKQRLTLLGFTIVLLMVVALPFVLFVVNRPESLANRRVVADAAELLVRLPTQLGAFFAVGDMLPEYNLPQRPLFDPLTFILVVIGFGVALVHARGSRYALLLIFLLVLLPVLLFAETAPNFLSVGAWLPLVAIFFALAVQRLNLLLRQPVILGVVVLVLLGGNLLWTSQDLFGRWAKQRDVRAVYHTDLHQLARHLDRTIANTNTVLCFPQWAEQQTPRVLHDTQKMLLMMNRRDLTNVRLVDCRSTLVFTNGGAAQQVVLVEANALENAHPVVREWLSQGTFLNDDTLPRDRVLLMDVEDLLASRLGVYTTTTPVLYGYDLINEDVLFPPVRFGGNVTWLGYQSNGKTTYHLNEVVEIVNYWRIEGVIPRDLTFFHHILSDPVTIVANRDTIGVSPRTLRERDVFVQVTSILLDKPFLAGAYDIAIGAYQSETGARLSIFDAQQQERGDRLILTEIEIAP